MSSPIVCEYISFNATDRKRDTTYSDEQFNGAYTTTVRDEWGGKTNMLPHLCMNYGPRSRQMAASESNNNGRREGQLFVNSLTNPFSWSHPSNSVNSMNWFLSDSNKCFIVCSRRIAVSVDCVLCNPCLRVKSALKICHHHRQVIFLLLLLNHNQQFCLTTRAGEDKLM